METKPKNLIYGLEEPILTEIFMDGDDEEQNPVSVYIDKREIFHSVDEKGNVRYFKYTKPFGILNKENKSEILGYRGINANENMYAGDVFMHGEFIQEIDIEGNVLGEVNVLPVENEFSIEKGIEIQTKQLAEWKTKLNEETYNALYMWATSTNREATDGYKIRRGFQLNHYIDTFKPMEDDSKNGFVTIKISSRTGEVDPNMLKENISYIAELIQESIDGSFEGGDEGLPNDSLWSWDVSDDDYHEEYGDGVILEVEMRSKKNGVNSKNIW